MFARSRYQVGVVSAGWLLFASPLLGESSVEQPFQSGGYRGVLLEFGRVDHSGPTYVSLDLLGLQVGEYGSVQGLIRSLGDMNEEESVAGWASATNGLAYFEWLEPDYEVYNPTWQTYFLAENGGSLSWGEVRLFEREFSAEVTVEAPPEESEGEGRTEIDLRWTQAGTFSLLWRATEGDLSGADLPGEWEFLTVSGRVSDDGVLSGLGMSAAQVGFAGDGNGVWTVKESLGATHVEPEGFTWGVSSGEMVLLSARPGDNFYMNIERDLMVGMTIPPLETEIATTTQEPEFFSTMAEEEGFPFSVSVGTRMGGDERRGLVGTYGLSSVFGDRAGAIEEEELSLDYIERSVLQILSDGTYRMTRFGPFEEVYGGEAVFDLYRTGGHEDTARVQWAYHEVGIWSDEKGKLRLRPLGMDGGGVGTASTQMEPEGFERSFVVGASGNVLLGLETYVGSHHAESLLVIGTRLNQKAIGGAFRYFPDLVQETPYGSPYSVLYGKFYDSNGFPWMTSEVHGSWYCYGGGGASQVVYDYSLQSWLYTAYTTYPNFYHYGLGRWIFYLRGTGSYGWNRWFWVWDMDLPTKGYWDQLVEESE